MQVPSDPIASTAPADKPEAGLLPCPFCGQTGQRVVPGPSMQYQNREIGTCAVLCQCGAMGPQDGEGNFGDEAGPAIAQWNHRATPTRSAEEDAFFEAALEYARKWHDPSRWCGERSLETNNRACDWDAMMAAYRALEARPK